MGEYFIVAVALVAVIFLYRFNRKRLEQIKERARKIRFIDNPRIEIVESTQVFTSAGCRTDGIVTRLMKRDSWGHWREEQSGRD